MPQSQANLPRFDTTKLLMIVIAVLVGGAFYIGKLSAKVELLEKGVGTQIAGTQQGTDTGAQAAPQPPPPEITTEKFDEIVKAGRHVFGNQNANVTIVEFSDFQCPFCKRFIDDAYQQIKKEYIDTGKVKLIYMHYPLTAIHPDAMNAALASECASEQGKFQEYHDTLFANQLALSKDNLKKYAADLGLNAGRFNGCLDDSKYKDVVDKEMALGTSNGIGGTPGFYINGKLVSGAQPFDNFKTVIEGAL